MDIVKMKSEIKFLYLKMETWQQKIKRYYFLLIYLFYSLIELKYLLLEVKVRKRCICSSMR